MAKVDLAPVLLQTMYILGCVRAPDVAEDLEAKKLRLSALVTVVRWACEGMGFRDGQVWIERFVRYKRSRKAVFPFLGPKWTSAA